MSRKFVFDCPACGVESVVDADIRAEVVEEGCVMCQEPVDTDAFVPLSETGAGRDTTQ
jgi:transcription elongation factor Elf1